MLINLKPWVTIHAAAIVTLLAPLSALSASGPAITQAVQLLEAGQPSDALALLEADYIAETASLQELFLLGISAKNSNNLFKSESYLIRAVALDPNAGRVRLELAEVFALQRKFDQAKAELQKVQQLNPPEKVQQNILNFMSQIDAAKQGQGVSFAPSEPPRSWNAYISAGLSYDSNVNASTDASNVTFFGLPFRLSDDARETQDSAWTLRAGINYQLALNKSIGWSTGLNGSFTDYFDADAYDNLSIQFSTGPSFSILGKGALAVPLTLSAQSYTDSSDDWYSFSYGVAPRLQYTLAENLQLGLNTFLSHKVYIENRDRDSTAWNIAPSLRFKPFNDEGVLNFGVNYARENSGQDIYSNKVKGAFVGYSYLFKEVGVTAGINASYSDSQYDEVQAAQSVARHDRASSISGSLSYSLQPQETFSFAKNSVVSLNASYTDNQSNIEINDYDRTQISLTFTKSF